MKDPSLTLRLYISADTLRSRQAVRNLKAIQNAVPPPGVSVEVIDVIKEPERAAEDRILATPTLCRIGGGSTKRVVGDLSDRSATLALLGVESEAER